MTEIVSVKAREIFDSRGYPTVEVDLFLKGGLMGRAAVPSGASTGQREALELRDGTGRFSGKGVKKAVGHVNDLIAKKLVGVKVINQKQIDEIMLELDGTPNKANLGANAILGVSLAAARAGALAESMPLFQYLTEVLSVPQRVKGAISLPLPLMNVINGGAHASNKLDIQEFMILPHSKKSFTENFTMGVEVFHLLKKKVAKMGLSTNVGDEGGLAPEFDNTKQALDILMETITDLNLVPGKDISLCLDMAASEFYRDGRYQIDQKSLETSELIGWLEELAGNYPIYSIEDALDENDFDGWAQLNATLGKKIKLIGDDLFVTNKKILQEGIDKKWANSILVKLNQIGSLTETFQTLELAFDNKFEAVISHRSGETADSFIADLAVACGAGHIKTGSASRTDRMEKYNQLLRIEEQLGPKALSHQI